MSQVQAWNNSKAIRAKQGEKRSRYLSRINRLLACTLVFTFSGLFIACELFIPKNVFNIREMYITVTLTLLFWLAVSLVRIFSQSPAPRSTLLEPLVLPSFLLSAYFLLWLYICVDMGHRYVDIAFINVAFTVSLQITVALTILASNIQALSVFGFTQYRMKSPILGALCLLCYIFLLFGGTLAVKWAVRQFAIKKEAHLTFPLTWQDIGMEDPFIYVPKNRFEGAGYIET